MKRWMIGALILGAASGVTAQTTQTAQQNADADGRRRVFMMEGVLERAVQFGVSSLRERVRAVLPDDTLLLSGAPEVRGFRLEGYGVMFDVEVPALRRSMAWSLRTMNESAALMARDLAQMRAMLASIPDQRARAEFERSLRRLQQQLGPVGPVGPVAAGGPEVAAAQAGPGAVAVANNVTTAAPVPVDPQLLQDPSEAYTQEVKAALIDAMVENSGSLGIGPDEWLTVAARDNVQVDRFMPGDPSEVSTIVLRIKGSDLAAYRAGRITAEEARTRVSVREF